MPISHAQTTISTEDVETILRSLAYDTIPQVAALLSQALNGDPHAREEALIALKTRYPAPFRPGPDCPPRARVLLLTEDGRETGVYEGDPGVEVHVYDFAMEAIEPDPPLPPAWRTLGDRAGVPSRCPKAGPPDNNPRVLVTMRRTASGRQSELYTENGVIVQMIDIDDLRAGNYSAVIPGFEDLIERMASLIDPENRAIL